MIPGQLSIWSVAPDELPDLAADLPRPAVISWWGFSADHSEAQAQADFRRRFGVQPAELRRVPGCLLAGPVPGM